MSNEISLGLAPLSHIRANLDRLFGKDTWVEWELETISLELNQVFDELTRDKISLLQTLGQNPDLFFEDGLFFLHAAEVMNNRVADFERMPVPTSLELAYALEEAKALVLPVNEAVDSKSTVATIVTYILNQEGYSEPIYPFTFVSKDKLKPGQTPEDTEAKKRAIEIYVKEMSNL